MTPNPWVLLGVAVVWALSLLAVGSWQREDGKTSERAACLAKENAALAAANKEIDRLRGVEKALGAQLITIGSDHADNLSKLEAQRQRDIANARAGALRLRIPASACTSAAGASASAQVSNGETGGELPPEITGRLFDLAADADRNTLQLGACQSVITSYLKAQEKP